MDREDTQEIRNSMNDVYTDLHQINVCDDNSRDAKQNAFLSLGAMRLLLNRIEGENTHKTKSKAAA